MSSLSRKVFLAVVAACALFAVATSPHAQEQKKPAAKAPAAKKGLTAEEVKYLRELGRRNLGEVQYSKIASGQALVAEVKEFAKEMAAHHAKALDEQRRFARSRGIELQESLSKKQQEGMKKVRAVKGTAFDKVYLDQMLRDHQTMLDVTKQAAAKTKDKQFKALLDKSVPEIEQHLWKVRDLINSRTY